MSVAPAIRPRGRAARRNGAVVMPQAPASALPALPPEWRTFVGHWLESTGCVIRDAARGDWEVELSPALRRRWRRQRVRLVFDPLRPTLPRGAWFTAPGSGAGRRILDAALEDPMVTRRTALAQVPGAPDDGIASVCKVRGLTWGPPRLGPVRYERRMAFHAVVTRWGGLPLQESWVVLIGNDGHILESVQGLTLPDVRPREGLYQITDELAEPERERWMTWAREAHESLLAEREREWERSIARLRDDELERLGAFFSARIEEEEERLRRRASHPEDPEMSHGDATSLKLEWERRAAEVRHRWAIRTEVRLWGLEEWSWPVAEIEQEVRAGAVHVRLTSEVDVARGRPALPACPTCGTAAEMLVRSRGIVVCARCA
ncbi:MAG TPA: hypothetical protein VL123_01275 [Candidatus Udaeobacter sp.]|jgi:hypothetical protein|nr:hypothetical protein [Candidatus Udaeobacter sp.]